MLCFRKFLVAEKFMDKREGEVSRFTSKFFLSHSAEKFVEEPLGLSLISGIEKVWMRGWGGGGVSRFSDFPSKISCLTVPKNFVGQPFRVCLISGIENFYASEGYVTIFCGNFLSHTPKIFEGEPLSISLSSGIKKC